MTMSKSRTVLADPAAASEVFYDGACPVCRREISVYQTMASDSVSWRDVSGPDAVDVDGRSQAALLARFHARRADGAIVSGFKAFLAVWRATPRLAWLGRLLDRQPFLFVGEGAYRAFLKVRPLWRRAS